jgi:hypothetical protein
MLTHDQRNAHHAHREVHLCDGKGVEAEMAAP